MTDSRSRMVALSGGIGGAKLALGLQAELPPGDLSVIVNTGDDFEHLGLNISPDLDTLMYTLAGVANPDTGWGLKDESWQFMAQLEALGGPTWFRLGDGDLATHVRRSELLNGGRTLTEVMQTLATGLGVRTQLLPMSDAPVRTRVSTDQGELDFQDYFVRLKAEPRVTAIDYVGSANAEPTTAALTALQSKALEAIVITPSNPWLSIAPILSLGALKTTIVSSRVPVIAVSPIVNGAALKGPTAKIMAELGLKPGVETIADFYADIVDVLIIDKQDVDMREVLESRGILIAVTNTIMRTLEDKRQLASFVLETARTASKRANT